MNFSYRPSYIKSRRRPDHNLNSRDNSYERLFLSKIDNNSSLDMPYSDTSNKTNSMVVLSKPVNLNSSFDPRTHNEIDLKGKYDYYKFGNKYREPSNFERNFDSFFSENKDTLDEIEKLNYSDSKYNSKQMKITDLLQRRLKEKE